jgi:hypothetical protein
MGQEGYVTATRCGSPSDALTVQRGRQRSSKGRDALHRVVYFSA